jgi:hypothetical protein
MSLTGVGITDLYQNWCHLNERLCDSRKEAAGTSLPCHITRIIDYTPQTDTQRVKGHPEKGNTENMPGASDTAYPRLKAVPSDKELVEVYTHPESELAFACKRTNQPVRRIGLLLLLKTFQRLGYFVSFADIPDALVRHISRCAGFPEVPPPLHTYDLGTARDRHKALVREYLGITPYGKSARTVIIQTCFRAARIFLTSSTWPSRS